jgi:phosphopantothenoylcysteine synthetase/decarboxylase
MSGRDDDAGVVYVIVCGAPPASEVGTLIKQAQTSGWDVCVIATPSAIGFIDRPALEELTGHPVRSHYKQPDENDLLPAPNAIIVAPATFNTINKWAAGISDTLALGLLTEAIGKRLRLIALPFINRAQAQHPAFEHSVQRLRAWGVQMLYGPDVYELHEPGTGSQRLHLFPWDLALAALDNW